MNGRSSPQVPHFYYTENEWQNAATPVPFRSSSTGNVLMDGPQAPPRYKPPQQRRFRPRSESPMEYENFPAHYLESSPNSITVTPQLTQPLSRFSYDSPLNRNDSANSVRAIQDDRHSDYGYYSAGSKNWNFKDRSLGVEKRSSSRLIDMARNVPDFATRERLIDADFRNEPPALPEQAMEQFRIFRERQPRNAYRPEGQYQGRRYRSLDRTGLFPAGSSRELDSNIDMDYQHVPRSRSTERVMNELPDNVSLGNNPHSSSNRMLSQKTNDARVFSEPLVDGDPERFLSEMKEGLNSRDYFMTKEKLNSTMNSIKTFWSPELKRERAMRKEESAKQSVVRDQLLHCQAELAKRMQVIKELELKVHNSKRESERANVGPNQQSDLSALERKDLEHLRRDREKHSMELLTLHKTVEELEIRLETQKQTIQSREESVKKLLEMLQSKGLSTERFEMENQELDALRNKAADSEQKVRSFEGVIEQKDAEIAKLKETLSHSEVSLIKAETELGDVQKDVDTSGAMLQIIKETKDSRIAQLDRELKIAEDKLSRVQEEGSATQIRKEESEKHVTILRSQEKLIKARMETMKSDVQRKEVESATLKSKVDTLEKQLSDQQKHISVLKEQIGTKETQIDMLHNDLDAMRERIRDRESTFEKKTESVKHLQEERRRNEKELIELREHFEIKERKIEVLQKKIENLDDMFSEKESQLSCLKTHMATLQADQSCSDSTVMALRQAVEDKDRQIDRMRQQRERADQIHKDECDILSKTVEDFRIKVEKSHNEVDEKQNDVDELKECIGAFKAERVRHEDRIGDLEKQLDRKSDELQRLQEELDQIRGEVLPSELRSHSVQLEQENFALKDEMGQLHTEIDRMLSVLKEIELERNDHEKKWIDMQQELQINRDKLVTTTANLQAEKRDVEKLREQLSQSGGNAEKFRKKEDQLNSLLHEREARVHELEEKLLRNAQSTADAEAATAQLKSELKSKDGEVVKLTSRLDDLHQKRDEYQANLDKITADAEAKRKSAVELQSELKKLKTQMFETKQDALLASLGEKDAHMALLEMTTKGQQMSEEHQTQMMTLNEEKLKLKNQIRDLNEKRMSHLQRQSTLPFAS